MVVFVSCCFERYALLLNVCRTKWRGSERRSNQQRAVRVTDRRKFHFAIFIFQPNRCNSTIAMMASRDEDTPDAPASADEGQVIVHRTMPQYGDKIFLPPGKSTHEEPAPYIGPGWICQINKRNSSGGTGPKADRFWLNADRSVRLRSIAEVERYLKGSNGGEEDGANDTGNDEKEGRPVRKKARTRSYDNDFVYDDDMGTDEKSAGGEGEKDDEENGSVGGGPDPINPFINSAVALSRGRTHFATAAQAAVGGLLNSKNADGSSKTYAYSWDSILGLDLDSSDAVVGTSAMAQYLKKMQQKEQGSSGEAVSAAAATPSQIMEMIRSLRPRTCRPPDGSDMVEVVHNKPSENALWYGKELVEDKKEGASGSALDQYAEEVDRKIHKKKMAGHTQDGGHGEDSTKGAEGDLTVPYSALSRLYESMCKQDASASAAVGEESTFRRECRYMTAPKVVETLRKYENTTVELDQRERDVMKMGRELGLLGKNGKDGKSIGLDVTKYLGYSTSS